MNPNKAEYVSRRMANAKKMLDEVVGNTTLKMNCGIQQSTGCTMHVFMQYRHCYIITASNQRHMQAHKLYLAFILYKLVSSAKNQANSTISFLA